MTYQKGTPMSSPFQTPIGRRSLLGILGAAGGAMALSACGGPSVTTGSGGATTASADVDFTNVKPADSIDFWSSHPGQSQEIEKTLVAKFEAEHKIKVNLITAGANYEEIAQKFQTAQAAKSGLPGVVVLSDVWWFRYFVDKTIIPLDSAIKKLEWELTDYQDSLVKDYQYGGKQWAMPYGRSTPLFYYNKDHFKAAGLPDRAPETWDEFAEWAPKLKAANGSLSGYVNAFQHPALAGYAGWTTQNLLWGNGGEWSKEFDITCDSDAAVKTFQWMQDSIHVGKWAGVSSKDASQDLASGAVSATLSSTGSLVGVQKVAKFNLGVGFLPGGSVSKSPVCPTGGAGLGVPSAITPEQQLAAAMFIKFVGQPENTAAFSAATGYMPNRKSADMSAVLAKNPLIQTAMDQLKVTRTQDYARVFLPGADQEMAKAAAAVLNEKKDPKASLTTLKTTLEGIYNNQIKPKLG